MIYHLFCSLTCYFVPKKPPKSTHLENTKKGCCQIQKKSVKYRTALLQGAEVFRLCDGAWQIKNVAAGKYIYNYTEI